uniref:Proprotein convertase subtilisin/kexin type 6 n=1 Tax=Sinocyclocheilus rhinocerous TaxID=307959 RepID=A0A673NJB6_9TELE
MTKKLIQNINKNYNSTLIIIALLSSCPLKVSKLTLINVLKQNCVRYYEILMRETCVSHCPLGYFEDGEARRCRRCHRGCEKCVTRRPNGCRSCRRGLYFDSKESTCVETCPVGYFHDDGQRRCLKCHENCLKCLRDADRCTACKDGFSLAGMTCIPECANGTFFNLEEMKCSPCHISCSTCTGHLLFYSILFYSILSILSCSILSCAVLLWIFRCEEHCLSCQGPGTSCTQCKDRYSLVSRTCIMNATCNNADEVFCEMVKSNRLCEKKLFRQFCCRTCLMTAG